MTAARIIAVMIGYLFGLFTTGYFYAKHVHVDIRSMGSGNIGTTNTFRTLGKKAGVLVFLGDGFKGVFAVLAVWLIFPQPLSGRDQNTGSVCRTGSGAWA